MNMISSLILVVSAVLVGQSMAGSVPGDGSLIQHPAPMEKFDRDQLIKQLSVKNLNRAYKGRVAEYVAAQLYAAKDKATTEVFEEVTVQSLIDLNQVALTSCSSESLNSRYDKFSEIYELDHKQRSPDLVFGIVVYVVTANLKTFEYCSKNREQVIAKGIAAKAELKKLFETMALPANKRGKDVFGDMPVFTPYMVEAAGAIHLRDLQAPYSGSLIKHPVRSGKLDKDQLIEKLSLANLQEQHENGVAEYIAEQLYTTKDKATTEVLKGVTVKSLIEMNTVGLVSCTKKAMDKMDGKLDKLSNINPEGKEFDVVFGIMVFALQTEVLVSKYCMQNRGIVRAKGLANDKHMDTFAKRLENGQRMVKMMSLTLKTPTKGSN